MAVIPLPGDRAAFDAANYPELHTNDADASSSAIHHSIGSGENQAAAGNHNHDLAYAAIDHNHDLAYAAIDHAHIQSYVWNIPESLASGQDMGASIIVPAAAILKFVYIHCKDPGGDGSTIVDVNINGTSIFTTQANRPELAYDDADKVAKSGIPDLTAVEELDVLTIDFDQVATDAYWITVVLSFLQT